MFRCLCVIVFAVAAFPLPASAVVIDSFNDTQGYDGGWIDSPSYSFDSATVGGNFGLTTSMPHAGSTLVLSWLSGPGGVDAEFNVGNSGLFAFDASANTQGKALFVYGDYSIAVGDLAAGGANAMSIDFLSVSSPVDVTIRATSVPSGGGGGFDASVLTLQIPGGISTPTSFAFLFDDFVVDEGSGADFSSIFHFGIEYVPVLPGTSFEVDHIETKFVAAVPEPSTYAMAGIGLLGLGVFVRKRRRRS